MFPSGVCGAYADWCRPTGGPTECFRIQLHCGESNTGIDKTDFDEFTLNYLLHTKVDDSSQGWGQCILEMADV